MSTLCLKQTKPIARKRHHCDGYDCYTEQLDIEKTPCTGWIELGQQYINQSNTADGEVWTFKTCIPCNELTLKYKLHIDD